MIATCDNLFIFFPINPMSFFENNIHLELNDNPVPIAITEFNKISDLCKYNWNPQNLDNVPECKETEFRDTISYSLVTDIFALQKSVNEHKIAAKECHKELYEAKVSITLSSVTYKMCMFKMCSYVSGFGFSAFFFLCRLDTDTPFLFTDLAYVCLSIYY